MPQFCNGCGTNDHQKCALFSVAKLAAWCTWYYMVMWWMSGVTWYVAVLTFGRVEHELQIHSWMSRQESLDASSGAPIGEEDNPTTPTDHSSPTGERGDAGAHDF